MSHLDPHQHLPSESETRLQQSVWVEPLQVPIHAEIDPGIDDPDALIDAHARLFAKTWGRIELRLEADLATQTARTEYHRRNAFRRAYRRVKMALHGKSPFHYG